jgi:hypothetical protein
MKRNRVAQTLAVLSIIGLLATAAGHGFLATPALLAELRKAHVDPEWITAIKAIWILLSVNMVFLAALITVAFFKSAAITGSAIANWISGLLIVQSGYLFYELGIFPGAVLLGASGALLLIATRLSNSEQARLE